jgi:hypothetical protein
MKNRIVFYRSPRSDASLSIYTYIVRMISIYNIYVHVCIDQLYSDHQTCISTWLCEQFTKYRKKCKQSKINLDTYIHMYTST